MVMAPSSTRFPLGSVTVISLPIAANGFSEVNEIEVGAEERIAPLTGEVPVRELAWAGEITKKLISSAVNNVLTERI